MIRSLQLTDAEKEEFKFRKWTLHKAPVQNNISWNDLNKVNIDSTVKKIILLVLLFLVSVLLITPLTVSLNYIQFAFKDVKYFYS